MIEIHPFSPYIPPDAKYLLLGSFVGREAVTDATYDWYYWTKRNQFWPIMERVYGIELKKKAAKQAMLERLGIAIADIIYRCERKAGSNLDANLVIVEYNQKAITEILIRFPIEIVYFTSRFVELKFKSAWKDILSKQATLELVCLPSPSPRYAKRSLEQKITRYTELLPKM